MLLKSSTAIYGARPTNSAFLTEGHPVRGSRRFGYLRDLVEREKFCNGYCRQVPEISVTTLRFSSIVGPTADVEIRSDGCDYEAELVERALADVPQLRNPVLRWGKRYYPHNKTLSAGNGYFLGLLYEEQLGSTIVGATFGYSLNASMGRF